MKLDKKVKKIVEKLIGRDGAKCAMCPSDNELTIDHIIPVAVLNQFGIYRNESLSFKKQGRNMQLLCRKCNSLKADRINWLDPKSKELLLWYIENLDTDLSPDEEELINEN